LQAWWLSISDALLCSNLRRERETGCRLLEQPEGRTSHTQIEGVDRHHGQDPDERAERGPVVGGWRGWRLLPSRSVVSGAAAQNARARIMPTGSYAFRAVDAATGDTIEGSVRNMRHTAEDQARRLGYEVVDSRPSSPTTSG
jgi:hypothetical protein